MLKQHNMFSGKVDLLTDPTDKRAQIALTLYSLDGLAGKVYGAQAVKPKQGKPERPEQTKLF
jgi:hypothetical protein